MQDFFLALAANSILKVAFWAWLIAQLLKFPINVLMYGRLDLKRLLGSGVCPVPTQLW